MNPQVCIENNNIYKDIYYFEYFIISPEISSEDPLHNCQKYKPKVYMKQGKMESRTQGIGGINNDVGHGTKM